MKKSVKQSIYKITLLLINVAIIFSLLTACHKPVIESSSLISEEDFFIYNNKNEVVMKPDDEKNGTILLSYISDSDKNYYTARGIKIGDSLDKLGRMYGKITPEYNSTVFYSALKKISLNEFVERYNEFKKDNNIAIKFDDILYGRLEFTISNGKIENIFIRNPKAVSEFNKRVEELIKERTK